MPGKLALLVLLAVGALAPAGRCDWINLSGAENAPNIAEIHIQNGSVRIELEAFVGDLEFFLDLIPDDLLPRPIPHRPSAEERAQSIARNLFQVITDAGERLPVQVGVVEPRLRAERPSPFAGMISPYTRRPIPGPPDDKRVLFAKLTYPFDGQPESLTFIPPVDEEGRARVALGFLCYHEGVPVVDFRHLSGANVLYLDWDDPWYSAFDNRLLKRSLQTGVRSYLYIEPYEVLHEILIRVKDAMAWIDIDLRGREFIEEDEFNPVRETIGQFLLERDRVLIDGRRLTPILDRTAFVESSMLRSRFIEVPERMPLNTAMVGVIITYLTDGIPGEVTSEWEFFSDRVQKVTGSMTDPAGPFPYDLVPGDNVLKWTNYLKNYTIPTVVPIDVDRRHQGVPVPLGSLACLALLLPVGWLAARRRRRGRSLRPMLGLAVVLAVGAVAFLQIFRVPVGDGARASQVSSEEGQALVDDLLRNVYRAFDFREEGDVYDRLAICVSGDLLADLYLEQRRSLVVEQAGGAQARVEEVDVEHVGVADSAASSGSLDLTARWTVLGNVGHWGHTHVRQNRYDAIVTIEPIDGAWKIVGLELLEETRIDPLALPQG